MENNSYVLGFDIGGTKIGIGLSDINGNIIGKDRIENVNTHPDDILPLMVKTAKNMVAENSIDINNVKAFGISAPFPADAQNGIMTAPANNPLWKNVAILDYMKNQLNMDGCFENDANCAALAEWFFGAGRGCKNFIYLTMSTGIGGGVIASNHLVRGGSLSAGELGHIVIEPNGRTCNCGLKGCYEAYSGGRAIAQRVQEDLKNSPEHIIVKYAKCVENIDMLAIEKAFRDGDSYAQKIWDEMSFRSAQAFGIFINTFNPEKIILGTMAWAIGDIYTEPIKKYLPQFCWKELLEKCEIVNSELKRDIGYYAGVAAAINYINEKNK